MTTSHATPTPPHPRSAEERSQSLQGQESGGRGGGSGSVVGASTFGLRAWQALLGAGVVTFVLGLIVLIWPSATLVVLALLFGCYLVLSGVMALIEGLSDRTTESAMRIAYIVLGVLGILLGLFCIRRIDVTVVLLAFLLAAFWIMRGVVDLSAAMSHREAPGRGLRAFSGVLSLIAGVLVLFWPGITLTILLVFAGIWLLVYGVMLAFLAFGLRRELRSA